MPSFKLLKAPTRRLRSSEQASQPVKREVSAIVEESHARQILNLPLKQRQIVIAAIQEGGKIGEIAEYFSEQGWLKTTENTFKQYLMCFKRVYPELCEGNDSENLDHLIDGKRPPIDEEVELERLYRMQKVRLKIGLDFEKNTAFINKDMHKDVEVTANIIDRLSVLRGKKTGAGRPSSQAASITHEAAESLRKADIGEAAQDRLVNAVSGLIGLVKDKNDKSSLKTET